MLFKTRSLQLKPYTTYEGYKVYPLTMDIRRGMLGSESITFTTADKNTGILSVTFVDGELDYNVSRTTVICTLKNPKGVAVDLKCNVVSECEIELPLELFGTASPGMYTLDFKIYMSKDVVIGTPTLGYSVSESLEVTTGDTLVPDTEPTPPTVTIETIYANPHKLTMEEGKQFNLHTIEGNSILALHTKNSVSDSGSSSYAVYTIPVTLVEGKEYTLRFRSNMYSQGELNIKYATNKEVLYTSDGSSRIITINFKAKYADKISFFGKSGYILYLSSIVLLEGNHVSSMLPSVADVGHVNTGNNTFTIMCVDPKGNLINNSLWETGTYNDSTGVTSTSSSTMRLPLSVVMNNTEYTFSGYANNIYFYDMERRFISKLQVSTNYKHTTMTITTPPNCRYIGLNYTYTNSTSEIKSLAVMHTTNNILCVTDSFAEDITFRCNQQQLCNMYDEPMQGVVLKKWDSVYLDYNNKWQYSVGSELVDYTEGDELLEDCITNYVKSLKKLDAPVVVECKMKNVTPFVGDNLLYTHSQIAPILQYSII